MSNIYKLRIFLLFALTLFIGSVASPIFAQDEENGITLGVTVGYDGFYKGEFWLPVQVTAANSGPSVEGYVEIEIAQGSNRDPAIYRSPISLATQSDKRVTLYVKINNSTSSLNVQLRQTDGTLIAQTTSGTLGRLSASHLLYGVVSPDAAEFAFLERISGGRTEGAVALLTLDDLPETAVAWNALDVLIFNDTDTSQLSNEQRSSLEIWLNNGGQLIVTGGANWQKTAVSLADLLPVTINGSQTVNDLPGLQDRIGIPFRDPGPYVVATSSLRNGELLFRQDDLPLLARQPMGRGAVYFLALDPRLAPLLDWDGSEAIWGSIANRVPTSGNWGLGPQNGYAGTTAVSSLPSLSLPNVLQLGAFLLLYTLVMGPLNYWILKRRNQLEKAWVTIPVFVLLFTAATYFTGFQLRGNDTIINQISVAYSQTDGEQADVYSLLGLYSPQRRSYDLNLPANALAQPFNTDFSIPFGNDAADLGAITYGNEVTISDVRVDIGDVGVFLAQSSAPAVDVSGSATLTLDGSDLVLEMDVLNNSDINLETVSVVLGNTAVFIGDIAAGERTAVSEAIRTTSSSSSSPSSPFGSFNTGAPLSANAETILDTFDFYNDQEMFPRWQLLQSLESNNFGGSTNFALPPETVVLIAWSEEQQLDVNLTDTNSEKLNTTMYLIEIPLQQNIVSGQNVTIPVSLLNWEPLGNNNVYNPTIQELYLNGGWVEFSYTPWPEFAGMEVTELGFSLTQQFTDPSQPLPTMHIWDFEQAIWQPIGTPRWGLNTLSEFAPFVGQNNEIRLRLEDNSSQFGLGIGEIYPVITGNLNE